MERLIQEYDDNDYGNYYQILNTRDWFSNCKNYKKKGKIEQQRLYTRDWFSKMPRPNVNEIANDGEIDLKDFNKRLVIKDFKYVKW